MINLDWKKVNGLMPAIIQDSEALEILMLGYMNKEALEKTQKSGYATFFSRTRNCLWTKGETSGNIQHLIGAQLDCDGDTLLLQVNQIGGGACHTGRRSCFFYEPEDQDWILGSNDA